MDPMFVVDGQGQIVYLNEEACRSFFGTTTKEKDKGTTAAAKAFQLGQLLPGLATKDPHALFVQVTASPEQAMDVTCRRQSQEKTGDDNQTKWQASLSMRQTKLRAPQSLENNSEQLQTYYIGTLRDITQRMERETLFKSVIDEAIDAIFTINEKGIITLVNASACRTFGYTSGTYSSLSFGGWEEEDACLRAPNRMEPLLELCGNTWMICFHDIFFLYHANLFTEFSPTECLQPSCYRGIVGTQCEKAHARTTSCQS